MRERKRGADSSRRNIENWKTPSTVFKLRHSGDARSLCLSLNPFLLSLQHRRQERSIDMSLSNEAIIAIVLGVPGLFISIISSVFTYITWRQALSARPYLDDVEQQPRTATQPCIYPVRDSRLAARFPATAVIVIAGALQMSIHMRVASAYSRTAAAITRRFDL